MTTTNPTPDAGGIDVEVERVMDRARLWSNARMSYLLGLQDPARNVSTFALETQEQEARAHLRQAAQSLAHRPAPGGGGVERVMDLVGSYGSACFDLGQADGETQEYRKRYADFIERRRGDRDTYLASLRQAVEELAARPGLRLEEGEVVVNTADLQEAMNLLTYQLDSMGIYSEACDRLLAVLAREGR